MRNWLRWLASLILATVASAASANVTAEQAHSLPVRELARLALGEVGELMVDVERPAYMDEHYIGPPRPFDVDHGKPPELNSLTFFTLPKSAGEFGWSGLCYAQATTITFDNNGAASSIESRNVYGASNTVTYSHAAAQAGREYVLWSKHENESCAAVQAAQHFVWAADSKVALRVSVALSIIKDTMAKGGAPFLKTSCALLLSSGQNDHCPADTLRNISSALVFDRIGSITPVSCKSGGNVQPSRKLGEPACYEISFGTQNCMTGDNVWFEVVEQLDRIGVARARFSRDRVVC